MCICMSASAKCKLRVSVALGCMFPDCNSFRLSLEWSRLFPRRGELNQEAVDRYNAIFDTLEKCVPVLAVPTSPALST